MSIRWAASIYGQRQAEEAARASWTNTGLVSALIFTIAVALWMADVPGELDDPATHWFLIFACAATLMSG